MSQVVEKLQFIIYAGVFALIIGLFKMWVNHVPKPKPKTEVEVLKEEVSSLKDKLSKYGWENASLKANGATMLEYEKICNYYKKLYEDEYVNKFEDWKRIYISEQRKKV